MAGDGQQIDAERRDVDRQLAGGLHGVGVEQRAARVGDGGELGDRLDGADLVVGEHHRDQRGAIGDQGGQGVGRDDARAIDAQPADLPAAAGEGPGGLQDRLVLDGADDEMTPARRLQRLSGAAHRQDVGLGAAAREDRPRSDRRRSAPPPRRARHRAAPSPAVPRRARWRRCRSPPGGRRPWRPRPPDRLASWRCGRGRSARISMIAPPLSLSSKTGRHTSARVRILPGLLLRRFEPIDGTTLQRRSGARLRRSLAAFTGDSYVETG